MSRGNRLVFHFSILQQPFDFRRQRLGLRQYRRLQSRVVAYPGVQRTHAPDGSVQVVEKFVGDTGGAVATVTGGELVRAEGRRGRGCQNWRARVSRGWQNSSSLIPLDRPSDTSAEVGAGEEFRHGLIARKGDE